MIIVYLALAVLIVTSLVPIPFKGYMIREIHLLGMLLGVLFLVTAIGTYSAAGVRAKVINEAYHTEFTQEEVFFSEDLIKVIVEEPRSKLDMEVLTIKEKRYGYED